MPVITALNLYSTQKQKKVEKTTEGYRVITNNGVFETKYVVNAAGVYSDEIHNMDFGKEASHCAAPRRVLPAR